MLFQVGPGPTKLSFLKLLKWDYLEADILAVAQTTELKD